MTDVVFNLPRSWVQVTVADLGKVVSGGTPSTKENSYWGGNISWISPSDLTGYSNKYISKGAKSITQNGLKNSSATIMPAGSIHFSSRAPIGYTVISACDMSTNQGFKSIVPAQGIFNEYIYYYFKSAKQLAESKATGTTFKEISGTAFSKLPVPLPPSNEQHRIVAKIEELFSELDKGIENLKTARAQLKVYRQALLKHAFEGKLTAQWRTANKDKLETVEGMQKRIQAERAKRYQQQLAEWKAFGKQSNKPKTPKLLSPFTNGELAELPELPEGWGWIKIGNICGCIVPNRDKPKTFSGDIPWITTPSLGETSIRIDYTEATQGLSASEVALYSAKVIPIDSVIMTCVGNFGLCAVVDKPVVINQQLHAFLPEESLNSRFLAYCIQWNASNLSNASTSTTIDYLNKEKCNSMPLPFCLPEEQNKIVELLESKLSAVDQINHTITDSLQQAEALRQSILKKALSGQLVPQNPSDEPASALLARIKAERATVAAKPRKNSTGNRLLPVGIAPLPSMNKEF